ncbi:YfbK domain-containing protein [Verrucomicrobium sp. BvORR106]|uniref:anti-sigma factor family protein n=1 Tax=Verrucomicrobium sp. BvORR106 TaxID=1403819 RepID=UPI00056F31B3|nr:YfbK domain-containing protein [Verrucomicrobium sp. BvORR106]
MNYEDHPDLTAYAMGELNAAQTTRVCQWLASSPEARAELELIQETLSVLQEAPSIPRRTLNPRQRETVLAMASAPARDAAVIPFATPAQPYRRPMWNAVKYAAAASLAVGAFVVGQKSAATGGHSPASPTLASSNEATTAQSAQATAAENLVATSTKVEPLDFVPVMAPPVVVAHESSAPVAMHVEAAVDGVVLTPEVRASAQLAAVAESPAGGNPATRPAAPAFSMKAFALAHKAQQDAISLQPKLLRPAKLPVPDEFAGVKLASPLPGGQKPGPEPLRKPDPQPALNIHSWKAEIASCPWDSSRRLLRFVARVPVDQPGVEVNEANYQLLAKFDPFHVQGYRLVAEKHMPPTAGATLATRFAWYEIIPSRNFAATLDRPVTLGTIELTQPRTANVANPTPLKILDRGQTWQDSREDFVFETAMVGFGLLLQGTENIGALNYKLVLDIAEGTKGADPQGERAKFIHGVRQAQRISGL